MLDGTQVVDDGNGTSRRNENLYTRFLGLFKRRYRGSRYGMCTEAHQRPVNIKKQCFYHNPKSFPSAKIDRNKDMPNPPPMNNMLQKSRQTFAHVQAFAYF